MVYFRKRLTPKIIDEINKMILNGQSEKKSDEDDNIYHNGSNSGGNSGTIKWSSFMIYLHCPDSVFVRIMRIYFCD